MALIDDIADFQPGETGNISTRLNELRDAVKEALLLMIAEAEEAGEKTTADAAQTALDRIATASDRAATEQALSDAVAVVTGGTASLSSEAGKIPIAGASGQIDGAWLGDMAARAGTLLDDSGDLIGIIPIDTTLDPDPGWVEKCKHHDWWKADRPSGKFLGSHADATAAAAVTGAAVGAWFHTSGTADDFRELTDVATPTANRIYVGFRQYPRVGYAKLYSSAVVLYDTTTGGPLMCRVMLTGGNWDTDYPTSTYRFLTSSAPTSASYFDGVLCIGCGNGVAIADFKANEGYRITDSSHGYLRFRGTLNQVNELVSFEVVDAALSIVSRYVADTELVRSADGGLTLWVATDEGISQIKNLLTDPVVNTGQDTTGHGTDVYNEVVSIGDEVLFSGGTGSGVNRHFISFDAEDDLGDFAYNTGPYVTKGGQDDSRVSINIYWPDHSTSQGIAASDSALFFAFENGCVDLLHNKSDTTLSLFLRRTSELVTGYLADGGSCVGCDNDSASVSDVELISNGDFSSGTDDWDASFATLSESGGVMTITTDDSGSPGRGRQVRTTVENAWYELLIDTESASAGELVDLYVSDGNTFAFGSAIASETSIPNSTTEHPLYFQAQSDESSIIVTNGSNVEGDYVEVSQVQMTRIHGDPTGNEWHLKASDGATIPRPLSPGEDIRGFGPFPNGAGLKSADIAKDFQIDGASAAVTWAFVLKMPSSATWDSLMGNYEPHDGERNGCQVLIGGDDTVTMRMYDTTDTGYTYSSDVNPSEGNLVPVAITFDGNNQTLWVNGKLRVSSSHTLEPATQPIHVGAQTQNGSPEVPFSGEIYLVKQIPAVLSADAIKRMAESDLAILQNGGFLKGDADVRGVSYDPHTDLVAYFQRNGVIDYFNAGTGERVKTVSDTGAGSFNCGVLYDGETYAGGVVDTHREADARSVNRLPVLSGEGEVGFDPGDADADGVYWLPKGHKPKRVHIDGSIGEPDLNGTVRDYTTTHNGFLHGVDPNGVVSSRLVVETEVLA